MTIEATWQTGNSLLFSGNLSQMDLADIGFAGLFGKSGYVAMAMFEYTQEDGFTRLGNRKNAAQFGTDLLIGGYNRWHVDKMSAAGVEKSVVDFFNSFNGNLRNTVGTGIKEGIKDE
ncbi:hypothetical protein ADIS_0427 [Lunatimonas lonarensis]|uniref:Uncharacterized protein n=2 Tax=Lunatimonas lonarensis TaxID=1232681 RepID=R7ZXY3_9BACT|nr:hypothetical protein ADIS_0427 [Lunatimonas lonarensis]